MAHVSHDMLPGDEHPFVLSAFDMRWHLRRQWHDKIR